MRWLAAWLIAILVGGATLATAWISDDALVTLRSVENLVAGDGFRWNVMDRAQTATHPLWILLLSLPRAITGESYFTAIGVSVALTAVCALLLARHAATHGAALAVIGLGALGSRAFVEFGTGGLENPLVYALLALFLREWIWEREPTSRLRRMALLGSLLALARQDVVLLIAPPIVMAMRGLTVRQIVRGLWPGFVVGLSWYAFALVYYGTIIPTPGYGKVVAADVAQSALLAQGLRYFVEVAARDPVTVLVLLGALAAGFWRPRIEKTALALGVALQALYTLRVGGDFMLGRFFTAAFVVALFLLARVIRGKAAGTTGIALVIAALTTGWPSWMNVTPSITEARIEHGVGNERAFYAETLGLWSADRVVPVHAMQGRLFADRERPAVILATTAGAYGFLGGRNVHIVEPFLCDPLLMRLPLSDPENWRIGHFKRRIPEGYFETLASGENKIHHPALAEYWDALEIVLRAPVWSGERWRVLLGYWSGDYDALLERYIAEEYRTPPLVERTVSQLRTAAVPGTHWYDVPALVVREGGLRVRREQTGRVSQLRLLVDGGGVGEIRFRRGAGDVGTAQLVVVEQLIGGSRWVAFDVPESARDFDGFDVTLRLDVTGTDLLVATLPVFAVLSVELIE